MTVGAGTNGLAQPANFSTEYSPTAATTGEGSTSMGFYNVLQGDAPYLKFLADNYAMSDNYHQAVMGGTGANHIMMGTGDAIWFSDANGGIRPCHRTTRRFMRVRRTPAWSTRSRTRTRRLAQTTGTQRTATVAVDSGVRFTAAVPTRTAPTRMRRAPFEC